MNNPARPAGTLEFTFKSVMCGLVFGVMFGAANAYLGLKAGLTVSTSIPIAVLSVMVFRMVGSGTSLEANMAQTVGSASSSLASGTIFTIPALFMWGIVPSTTQVAALAFCGAVLGILAMIPLRRLLLVQSAATLPYPEGRACAEVIRAAQSGGSGARWIVFGILAGALPKLAMSAFGLAPEELTLGVPALPNAVLAIKVAPALIAVGFIIGLRSAAVMVSGALISTLVLIPLLSTLHQSGAADAGSTLPLLTTKVLRDRFLIFIGAGAVAAAAIITVVRTVPTMVASFAAVVRGLRGGGAPSADRSDRDLPPMAIAIGMAVIFCMLTLIPGIFSGDLDVTHRGFAAAGVLLFAMLFVPVSSRLVGVIGVSSNPTSAMALITLAGTAALFALGGDPSKAAVLTVGTVVCIAASKAGDISQDLKTGQLLGATPALQQFGQLIAAAVACFAIAGVVVAIGNGPEGFGPDGLPAPQARLMKTVIDAVLGAELPWEMVLSGAALGGAGALAGLPALPFALGLYLPLATMSAVFLGGLLRGKVEGESKSSAGVLCASGLVAGEGLAAVGIAGRALATGSKPAAAALNLGSIGLALVFLAITIVLLLRAKRSTA
ncbi:MAG: oligopeptide transporter, OPT family [Planctomycetes bacterium]|nr:oligopeptide transporter, OPT family [Planctomycetota bacterium]